jgi:hypothetical protein
MDSIWSEIECPECGFERATSDFNKELGCKHIKCWRCGFFKATKSGKATSATISVVPGPRKIGGRGCFICRYRGEKDSPIGPVSKKIIEWLRAESGKMVVCKYTFKQKGQWFIRDLLTNKTMPFSYERFVDG